METVTVNNTNSMSLNDNSQKDLEEDVEVKKYISEISRLKVMLKKKDAQIESLNKKLNIKGKISEQGESFDSDSIRESDDQSDHSMFSPGGKGDSNNRKRGRSKKVNKTIQSTTKSRGRPRKFPNDEQSSFCGTAEKKGRGRPRKSVGNPSTPFQTDSKRKSRGRPRKIINDQSSNSNDEFKDKDTDSEPKEKRPKGRPRKSIIDDQSSNSAPEPKNEESDSKDKDSTIDDSEPVESKSPGRPKKSFGIVSNREVDKSAGSDGEKKHKGRPRKNLNNSFEIKEKRARGRPKTKFENTTEDNSSTLENMPVKSRGRPKKSKVALEEVDDSM